MAWRPAALFQAFARTGLLSAAVYKPAGAAVPFQAQLRQPDVLALAGDQQLADVEIEYETAAIPALRRGDAVQITDALGVATVYTARAHAARQGDGYYSRCQLDKA